MCGILALHAPDGIAPWWSAFLEANRRAAHRGPDGAGIVVLDPAVGVSRGEWSGGNLPIDPPPGQARLALGHNRLSIVDLSEAAAQPMADASGRVWLSYNGEIYNHVELRAELAAQGCRFRTTSDTEVILHAYLTWGTDCVRRFNGMWALVIADLAKGLLFGSRDRFGIKPFHYHHDAGRLAIASEIKQLLALPYVGAFVNRQAIGEFLAFGTADHLAETAFRGIHRLEPGGNLLLDLRSGVLRFTSHASPVPSIERSMSSGEAARRFREMFLDSVRLQLRSDVEVGSCLSGGLDSSAIVCAANRQLRADGAAARQRTFSAQFDAPELNERAYVEHVLQATGVENRMVRPAPERLLAELPRLVWHQEEPFGSTSIFAQWCVFGLAREAGVKVMLDGQGADEMFGGYLGFATYYFRELGMRGDLIGLARELTSWLAVHRRSAMPILAQVLPALRRFVPPSLVRPYPHWMAPGLAAEIERSSPYLENQRGTPFGPDEVFQNALYQLATRNNLPTLLRYEDRNSMAFSVEARVPFLDDRLFQLAFSMPAGAKIRRGYTKRALRDGLEGVLPEKVRWRVSKLGFATPEHAWQSGPLAPLIEAAIARPDMRQYLREGEAAGYFQEVRSRQITDFAPWRWLSVVLWKDRFSVRD